MVSFEPRRHGSRRLDPASDRGRVDLVLSMVFVGIAAIFAGLAYLAAKFVAEDEAYALVRDFEVVETGNGPTVLFRVPFGDEIVTYPSGEIDSTFPAAHYLTDTKVTVPLKISVRWKIDDPGDFHHAVYSELDRATSRIGAYSLINLKDVVRTADTVDASSLDAIGRAVRDKMRPKAEEIGIEVIEVTVEQENRTSGG